jgi:hypothetical protein
MAVEKKVISVNLDKKQIKELNAIMVCSGIDNQQIHIRLAITQYIEREKVKYTPIKFNTAVIMQH